RFGVKTLAKALAHPRALAVGEVTRWPDAWRGDAELLRRLGLAPGGRVEGHTAGASGEKISAIAAAGFTSDHEPSPAQAMPGRSRELCVLDDLAEPGAATVIGRGKVVATGGRLVGRVAEPPWRRVFSSPEACLTVRWRARPDDFELPGRARYPVIELVSAVISRLQERPMQPGDLHAALLDRAGRWVAPGVVAGFADRIDGFATTTST